MLLKQKKANKQKKNINERRDTKEKDLTAARFSKKTMKKDRSQDVTLSTEDVLAGKAAGTFRTAQNLQKKGRGEKRK